MKFTILHISDIHLKRTETANPILTRVENIAKATFSLSMEVECIFVLVSGDIAFSGCQEEYHKADIFFKQLLKHLNYLLPTCDVRFIFIPGNHDCDFSTQDAYREIFIEKITESDLDKDIFRGCTSCQANYFEFVKKWQKSETIVNTFEGILWQEVHKISEDNIKFNLINSAWMSTTKVQQGHLLFPYQRIDELNSQKSLPESVVISVFHHPYNWFDPSNGRKLRESIEKCSDIIFTGHEHEGDYYQKSRGTVQKNEYIEGEVLQEAGESNKSKFHVVLIDLESQCHQISTFSWNKEENYYPEEEKSEWVSFNRNSYRLKNTFILQEKFNKQLSELGTGFTHHATNNILLDDIFDYPNLRRLQQPGDNEWAKTIVKSNIPDFILENPRILLVGSEKCGKTSIAKMLFKAFRRRSICSGPQKLDRAPRGRVISREEVHNDRTQEIHSRIQGQGGAGTDLRREGPDAGQPGI